MQITRSAPKVRLSVQLNHDAHMGVPTWVDVLPDLANQDPEVLYIVYVPSEQRDIVMGLFIEMWDALEERLHHLFHRLVGTPHETTNTLLSSFNGTKAISDAIYALAEAVIEGDDLKRLENLLDRVRKIATKRNRIIHGRWEMLLHYETVKGPSGVVMRPKEGAWERIYQPISPSERDSLMRGSEQQVEAKYRFSLDRLAAESQTISLLVDDLSNYISTSAKLPPMRL